MVGRLSFVDNSNIVQKLIKRAFNLTICSVRHIDELKYETVRLPKGYVKILKNAHHYFIHVLLNVMWSFCIAIFLEI